MWAADRRYRLIDTPMRVAVESSELAARIGELLAPLSADRPARASNTFQVTGSEGGYRLYQSCIEVDRTETGEDLLVGLVARMNRRAVERSHTFAVHAGVVSFGDRTLAFPAPSGGGKTTLVAACLTRGATYLSDEALILDAELRAVPYPKPLALSDWSAAILGVDPWPGETLVTAAQLGADVAQRPAPLTDLLIPHRAPGAGLEPLPRSETAATLLRLSFNHYRDPRAAFGLATAAARRVRAWRLSYDDPGEAARLLAETFG
ncbi:MAG: hypothetical protein KatS3mg011_0866 [Acidimicrobiia bacterium]|nr:MAG: hypothetical protein KatS3mg011_0866 [Acidimicrobiia bacterium]